MPQSRGRDTLGGGGKLVGKRARTIERVHPAQLDVALGGFEAAAAACGGAIERWYEIARRPVLIRYAGNAMAERLGPAIAHLETAEPPGPASMTITAWDTESTNTPLDPAVGSFGLHARASRETYDQLPELLTSYGRGQTGLSLFDPERRLGCYWIADAADIPFWERSGSFRALIHWWANVEGLEFVHGAAAGRDAGGVLFVGRNGSGKSTSALACLEGGLLYAGDDHVLIEPGDPPSIHSLYSAGKLRPDNRRRFPELDRHVANESPEGLLGDEKALFFLQEARPDALTRGFPMRAIVVPRLTGGDVTRLVPTSHGEALAALAPSSILQLPGTRRTALHQQLALARSVPAYRLELGGPVEQIPQVVGELLDEL